MSKQRILNKSLEENFKGIWIPKGIWLCDELTPIQMLVLMQIDSLDGKFGCTASNAHIALFFGVHAQTISDHIQTLQNKDFIKCTNIDESGVAKRTIHCTRKFKLITADLLEDLESYRGGKENTQGGKENTQGGKENTDGVITLEEHIDNNIINNIIEKPKKGTKAISKCNKFSLDEAISFLNNYNLDLTLLKAFIKFLEDCRYGKGKANKPVSEYSLDLLVNKLKKIGNGSIETQLESIQKSIINGYLDFFENNNFKQLTKSTYRANDIRNNDQWAGQ